jgi:ABC-type phosphate transport system substrate-binding protein
MRVRVRALQILITVALLFAMMRAQTVRAAAPPPSESRSRPSQYLAIVVNRSNPINNLSFSELRKIFLGERNHWASGHRIAIAMLDYGQPERRTVLRLIYRMDEDAYQDHLLRGMFQGDVLIAPRTLASPAIVRKFVFNAPGAIGYLRASDVDDTVKVVRIDGLLPDNKDYRLQIDEPAFE